MHSDLNRASGQLSNLLYSLQVYWRPIAFYEAELPWMAKHPKLTQDLLAQPLDSIEHLARDDRGLADFFSQHLPFTDELYSATQVGDLSGLSASPVNPRFHAGIPGRKWQQVEAFARCVPITEPVLEWCAGKSHLGFYLQHCSGQAVTALEWDGTLVAQANVRAGRDQAPLQSVQLDVMSTAAEPYVREAGQIVALHACGDLHERLLQLCAAHPVSKVHLAPCCYHKRAEELYVPLSRQARSAGLILTKRELHLAVMETATAGARVQRQRRELQVKRLGFDELQREVRGTPQYLPVPPLPNRWADVDFESFCRHCADLKQLSLPASVQWDEFLRRGEQRFRRVAALDLVRFLFRRPLEVWLALDRALLLRENGYQVRLGTFCSSRVTPRNLLLQAWRD